MVVLSVTSRDDNASAEELFNLNKASSEANVVIPFHEVSGVGEGAFYAGDPANILTFRKNNANVTVAVKGKFNNNLQTATDIAKEVVSGM